MNAFQNFLASPTGKFTAGFISTGGGAFGGFLAAQGCQISSPREFAFGAAIAIIGGVFHLAKNGVTVAQPTPPTTPSVGPPII